MVMGTYGYFATGHHLQREWSIDNFQFTGAFWWYGESFCQEKKLSNPPKRTLVALNTETNTGVPIFTKFQSYKELNWLTLGDLQSVNSIKPAG